MLAKSMLCLYRVKSYCRKAVFAKNGYFYGFCSIVAKPLTLAQIRRYAGERALKELSNAVLCSTVALLVNELCASLSKNVEIGKI